jgi:hypothetical protein
MKAISDQEKKLGMYTCPTGDFSYHVAQLLTTGSEYAEGLGSQRIPARDARMGTRYQPFPKLIYGAAAVTHSLQKLEDVFQSIWYKLLPSLHVNRNITKEYRMLPLRFQGLALPNPNIDVLSKKIHLLQSHWDTGSTLGRMLHQAYQVFQVKVGLGGNIFSPSFISFGRLATHGFFHNLWELLHRYGVVFCLHSDFDIPLLWQQDCTLMDAVHDTGIFDRQNRRPSIGTGTLKGCTASVILWYAAMNVQSFQPYSPKRRDRALETSHFKSQQDQITSYGLR